MGHNPVIAAILGMIGTIMWCVQLIPQIIVNYYRHSTAGLQPFMMLLWSVGAVFMGIYNISRKLNIPLQLQPQCFLVLCFITWGQCLYYESAIFIFGGSISALIETISIFFIKKSMKSNIYWPVETVGIISSALVCLGFIPPYYDIYIHKSVRGISFIFFSVDIGGAAFSFLSLFFEIKMDILAAISYSSVIVLELAIIFCDYYFKLSEWNKRRIEKKRSSQEISKTSDLENINVQVQE
ncbi:hypothetical protein PORY_002143 [Pneumocystis oryctolagi]|uniref:Uncharacterized protein n=1 Tax=Pneumocystis oryctolagi TaxID=42067 RepID=A0ACB7CBY3_9ASCO|nr:hypothetical protein PORY_002143 [Pneumocystis oryctolagi]